MAKGKAAAIVGKAIGLTAGNAADVTKFIDSNNIASWAKKSVAAAAEQKIINGYPDGKFQPTKSLTRVEAIAILDAASGYNLSAIDNITTTPGGTDSSVTDSTYGNTSNSGTNTDTSSNTSTGTTSGSETDSSTSTDSTTTNTDSTTSNSISTTTDTTDSSTTTTTDTTDVAATSDTLKVNEVHDGDYTITGTAKAGSTVTAYSNDLPLGSAVAKDDGTFSINVFTQKATVKLVVKAKDTDGKESEPVEVPVAGKRSE
jgi:hypothetical protein